ncbi:hypothetical protein VM1G_11760 [Cytospora mali]|uniref:AAA+ ATPase lid domain-containing protein n=1 Tax=Cytospora mali TaxID=578113 RepID=A0A194W5D1_CYTMA|nr:hypothetical protein VM1G_11760 [Valsa mali]
MEELEKDEKRRIRVDRESIMKWATLHFQKNLELGRWNGRQIRNAFQTAASLAHFDALDPEPVEVGAKQGVLNWTYPYNATDVYMATAKRATAHEFARKEMILVDDYNETLAGAAALFTRTPTGKLSPICRSRPRSNASSLPRFSQGPVADTRSLQTGTGLCDFGGVWIQRPSGFYDSR